MKYVCALYVWAEAAAQQQPALTCPPDRFLALSYRSSMWAEKDWKSGTTNFFLKACVSRTMLLWTHLRDETSSG